MSFAQILITGQPGVGKTTIIKRLAADLKTHNVNLTGFYTEECRDDVGVRIGFDVVLVNDGTRSILARTRETSKCLCVNMLGKYCVHVEEFQKTVTPLFNLPQMKNKLLIIDEIGKMELLSKEFERAVKDLNSKTGSKRQKIIATIPVAKGPKPIKVIEELKEYPETCFFTVTRSNRDSIYDNIFKTSMEMWSNKL